MARSSRLISTSLLLALVASAACLATAQASSKSAKRAVCFLADPTGTSSVVGRVVLSQSGNGATTLNGTIDGLAAGLHGFHIHELGDITGGCTSTGGHYNPRKVNHGGLDTKPRHVGDLGNIETADNGVTEFEIESQLSLSGPYSIIGRACVIHANADDLGEGAPEDTSKASGNAGPRLACGVVGLAAVE